MIRSTLCQNDDGEISFPFKVGGDPGEHVIAGGLSGGLNPHVVSRCC